MKEPRYIVVDPINGPVKGTEATTRIKSWRAFICTAQTSEDDFPAAVEECEKDGFRVLWMERL